MTETTLTRKDMKEPDKFQQAATQAASWIAARRKHVVLAGALVVAAVVVLAILKASTDAREERAGQAASQLLATVGGEISPVPLPGLPGPFFPSDEARQHAVVESAQGVLAAHPGTGAAQLAALALGDAQSRLRAWDDAKAAYERMGREAPAFGDRADLERARVLARAGKTGDAKAILTAFGEQHKSSLLTADASQLLARLGGK